MRRITHNIVFKDRRAFLYHFIKTYDTMFMRGTITETEVYYLTELVLIHEQGVPITSKKANRLLRLFFNTQDQDRSVWIYRGRLKKKGWLIQTTDSIELHSSLLDISDKLHWNVTLIDESLRESKESA